MTMFEDKPAHDRLCRNCRHHRAPGVLGWLCGQFEPVCLHPDLQRAWRDLVTGAPHSLPPPECSYARLALSECGRRGALYEPKRGSATR